MLELELRHRLSMRPDKIHAPQPCHELRRGQHDCEKREDVQHSRYLFVLFVLVLLPERCPLRLIPLELGQRMLEIVTRPGGESGKKSAAELEVAVHTHHVAFDGDTEGAAAANRWQHASESSRAAS